MTVLEFGRWYVAAERRKNVAPGASPGVRVRMEPSPGGAKDTARNLSPLQGLSISQQGYPGLAPGATFFGRSAARKASSEISKRQVTNRAYCVSVVASELLCFDGLQNIDASIAQLMDIVRILPINVDCAGGQSRHNSCRFLRAKQRCGPGCDRSAE